ncbi:MAG: tungsten formylmethanofuran dehydrogenase [Ignavibacteriales bacterium CG18_big_fil_WC_8_21_14_2_50_31_20]|nr:MAG: tungsten formylmethanofuran dehydrogenase [Ignavibacteriales bacterium CG18_big_fil_WC_8_21_14_2_50_31_20]
MVVTTSNKKNKLDLIEALKLIAKTRFTDKKVMNLLKQGKSFFHMSPAGHEAIQVACALEMKKGIDWAFPYYRDLAFMIAIDDNLNDIFSHMLAKKNDPMSGGRQLPCHWASTELNIPAQSSPTGTQFLQAVGTALSAKLNNTGAVTYVSSGEGTTSQGEFHEAVNWASREKLPVVFVIENNKYAISVPVHDQSGGLDSSIAHMMAGFDRLLRLSIDGTNFEESANAAKKAFEYARSGKGPVLIEAHVVRLESHSSSDDQRKYREKESIDADKEKDPLKLITEKIIADGILSSTEIDNINAEMKKLVESAADFALALEDPNGEDADKFVLDESGLRESLEYEKTRPSGNPIVLVDAINHALVEEMTRNEKIILFGEDVVDHKGGVFTATKGLSTKFGPKRVFNSPLAEASIAGVGIGLALTGMKPLAEIQFGDYIWPAFMQIRDELAAIRYRSNNKFSVPMVYRVPVGGYIHGGPYHSQNIEGFFAHIPGLLIAYPSNASDAKGLLKTALRLNDPVIFLEHKGLYRQSYASSPEPDSDYLLPFGKANVVTEGNDLSVITYGAMVHETNFAVRKLREEGFSVEIVDIRTINPLDEKTIFESVKKTGKAIVIHEDTLTAGFGAEIVARITENCFEYLDGPVKRVAGKDAFVPYHPILENDILPNREKIYNSLKELLKY